jgi:NADPH:quinone reductase-like Zn-dependent oxidoreductase
MNLLLAFLLYATALSVLLARRGFRSVARTSNPAPSGQPTRVLIVGATGGTGRHLVAQALERGHLVTALARDPSALRIEHPRLRVVSGNVLDYASVEAAVRGQEAVVSALGHKRFFYPTRTL